MRGWWATLLCLALLSAVVTSSCRQAGAPVGYKTRGHPLSALVTPDGRHLLVSEDSAGDARSADGAGLEVFRIDGDALTSERFIPLPANPGGMTLISGSSTFAFGLVDGLGLLDLDAALQGLAKPAVIHFGKGDGPFALTTSRDGRFLFASVEYGGGGEVEIIAIGSPKSAGQYATANIRGLVPVPFTATDLVLSPSGSRLYVVSEVAPPGVRLSGVGQPMADRNDCRQGAGRPDRNGVLYTFDVAALMRLSARPDSAQQDFAPAILSRSAAGCSPVRLVISANGNTIFVTARGENRVLTFAARKLESDPDHALIRSLSSGGEAPVGLQMTAGGKRLVVADSNRFRPGPGAIAVLDAQTGDIIARFRVGTFPRNVAAASNGVIFVTDFGSKAIEVLRPPQDSR